MTRAMAAPLAPAEAVVVGVVVGRMGGGGVRVGVHAGTLTVEPEFKSMGGCRTPR